MSGFACGLTPTFYDYSFVKLWAVRFVLSSGYPGGLGRVKGGRSPACAPLTRSNPTFTLWARASRPSRLGPEPVRRRGLPRPPPGAGRGVGAGGRCPSRSFSADVMLSFHSCRRSGDPTAAPHKLLVILSWAPERASPPSIRRRLWRATPFLHARCAIGVDLDPNKPHLLRTVQRCARPGWGAGLFTC